MYSQNSEFPNFLNSGLSYFSASKHRQTASSADKQQVHFQSTLFLYSIRCVSFDLFISFFSTRSNNLLYFSKQTEAYAEAITIITTEP